MLQKNNRERMLDVFFDDPLPKGIGFQLREISRKAKIAPTSVKRYLDEFEKGGIILKAKHRIHGYPVYYANRDNEDFKLLKKVDTVIRIKESGLLDCLSENLMPDVIVLFGSASKGEDLKDSDLDIFLQCKESKINVEKYEKELGRSINLLFEGHFNRLSPELKNNIINGIILKGYLKVF